MSRVIRRNEGEKHSVYNVTLSTLRRPHDDAERQQLEQLLDNFQDYLATPDGYDQVFGSHGPNDHVVITAGRPEVGDDPRGSRVHIHFVADAIHEGLHHAPTVQARMREAFIEYAEDHGVQLSGAYAYVQVDSRSYMLNYVDKYGSDGKRKPTGTQYIKRLEKDLQDAKKRVTKK